MCSSGDNFKQGMLKAAKPWEGGFSPKQKWSWTKDWSKDIWGTTDKDQMKKYESDMQRNQRVGSGYADNAAENKQAMKNAGGTRNRRNYTEVKTQGALAAPKTILGS